MKSPSLAAVSLAALLLTTGMSAYASSDVLLPENNEQLSHQPESSSSPPPPPSVSTSSLPLSSTPSVAQTPATSVQIPAGLPTSATPYKLPYTPEKLAPIPRPQNIQIGTPTVSKNGNGVVVTFPTSIIQIPEPPPLVENPNASKPSHNISIAFTEHTWNDSDIAQVNKVLGLDKDKIPSLCHIHASGSVITDIGSYPVDAGPASRTDIGYDGALHNIMLGVQALCKAVPLPPNQGFIREMGDKYVVDLGTIFCTGSSSTPNPTKATLTRTAGSMLGTCKVE